MKEGIRYGVGVEKPLTPLGRQIDRARGSTSVESLAAKSGLKVGMVHSMRKGPHEPGVYRVAKVAQALGVSLESLLGLKEGAASVKNDQPQESRLSAMAIKIAEAWQRLPPNDQDAVESQVRYFLARMKKDTRQDTPAETSSRHTARTDRRKARG